MFNIIYITMAGAYINDNYHLEYYKENAERIKENRRKRYKAHNAILKTCDCGSTITDGAMDVHLRSNIHQKKMNILLKKP